MFHGFFELWRVIKSLTLLCAVGICDGETWNRRANPVEAGVEGESDPLGQILLVDLADLKGRSSAPRSCPSEKSAALQIR